MSQPEKTAQRRGPCSRDAVKGKEGHGRGQAGRRQQVLWRRAGAASVSLTIADGEFCGVRRSSGCGKSTLLRSIAGLEEISGGTIHIGARDVTRAAPSDRDVAMVFQSYALYPHMTVRENMDFGMKVNNFPRRPQAPDRRGRADPAAGALP